MHKQWFHIGFFFCGGGGGVVGGGGGGGGVGGGGGWVGKVGVWSQPPESMHLVLSLNQLLFNATV